MICCTMQCPSSGKLWFANQVVKKCNCRTWQYQQLYFFPHFMALHAQGHSFGWIVKWWICRSLARYMWCCEMLQHIRKSIYALGSKKNNAFVEWRGEPFFYVLPNLMVWLHSRVKKITRVYIKSNTISNSQIQLCADSSSKCK
jgi:hypothetical protein